MQNFFAPLGIPIHTSPRSLGLAREFPLPPRQLLGNFQILTGRGQKRSRQVELPVTTRSVALSSPQEVNVYKGPLDRVEARGMGFSEMQSYWQLPFHDTGVAGDVCVFRDGHDRQLYDTIHVATSNPVWLYSMVPTGDKFSRMSLNHCFETRRHSVIPRRVRETLFESNLYVKLLMTQVALGHHGREV